MYSSLMDYKSFSYSNIERISTNNNHFWQIEKPLTLDTFTDDFLECSSPEEVHDEKQNEESLDTSLDSASDEMPNMEMIALNEHKEKLEQVKEELTNMLIELTRKKDEALENPLLFIKELTSGNETIPPLPEIPEYPDIDLRKYQINGQPVTFDNKIYAGTTGKYKHLAKSKPDLEEDEEDKVRGRISVKSNSRSFNQLWSPQEQKKLEELLEIYPEEMRASKRWKKISEELGTRTPQQVASRVQKYFLKLSDLALPVPGRGPSPYATVGKKRMYGKRSKKEQSLYTKNSTFLTSIKPAFIMSSTMDDMSSMSSM